MISLLIHSNIPSFGYLGDLFYELRLLLKVSQLDKAFDTIVRDSDIDMEEESDDPLVSVAIVDDKAYWVVDNTFYVADVIEDIIDRESSRPINAFEMNNRDLYKMLYILDSLYEG